MVEYINLRNLIGECSYLLIRILFILNAGGEKGFTKSDVGVKEVCSGER